MWPSVRRCDLVHKPKTDNIMEDEVSTYHPGVSLQFVSEWCERQRVDEQQLGWLNIRTQ